MEAFSLVVELRRTPWEALDFLEQLGVTVCNLDYPTSRQSFNLQLWGWRRCESTVWCEGTGSEKARRSTDWRSG